MNRDKARSAAPCLLPRRARSSSKHDYGRLLIVGGSTGLSGAPTLASRAAVRAGAGLVHLMVPESIYLICAIKNDEAMVSPAACDAAGRLTCEGAAAAEALLARCDALCIGPGLGKSEGTAGLTRRLIEASKGHAVVDADALWAVSRAGEGFLRSLAKPAVLTPHAGEFERYLGGSASEPRDGAARSYAEKHGCILVLKGAGTVVAFPDGSAYVNQSGNPGLARGGSGDALTGIIGALLCQLPAEKAVPLGVYLHGLAGDLAAEARGEYGMTVTDVINFLPEAMKLITEE